ncbi:hypothetical protein E4T56_gene2650 [Termitomyces sp. T112]|nr:hypothetical protein E4T56_gene2650 [Termitomyces sp. T112]
MTPALHPLCLPGAGWLSQHRDSHDGDAFSEGVCLRCREGLGALVGPFKEAPEWFPSLVETFLCHQVERLQRMLGMHEEELQRVEEDWDMMQQERDVAWRDRDEVQELREQLAQLEAWVVGETEG